RITAAVRPPVASRWAFVTCTGAAVALFCVNTPAALTATPSSVATRLRSGAPLALMPAAYPAATNPRAAVTLMLTRSVGPLGPPRPPTPPTALPASGAPEARSWIDTDGWQAHGLGQAQGQV